MRVKAGAAGGTAFRQRESRRLADEEAHIPELLRRLAAHEPRLDANRVKSRGRLSAHGWRPMARRLVPISQAGQPSAETETHGRYPVEPIENTPVLRAEHDGLGRDREQACSGSRDAAVSDVLDIATAHGHVDACRESCGQNAVEGVLECPCAPLCLPVLASSAAPVSRI